MTESSNIYPAESDVSMVFNEAYWVIEFYHLDYESEFDYEDYKAEEEYLKYLSLTTPEAREEYLAYLNSLEPDENNENQTYGDEELMQHAVDEWDMLQASGALPLPNAPIIHGPGDIFRSLRERKVDVENYTTPRRKIVRPQLIAPAMREGRARQVYAQSVMANISQADGYGDDQSIDTTPAGFTGPRRKLGTGIGVVAAPKEGKARFLEEKREAARLLLADNDRM